MEQKKLVEAVLEKTREGAITFWVERIAQLALKTGVAVEKIDWSGSPYAVSARLVAYVLNGGIGKVDDFLGEIGFIGCSTD